MQTLNVAHVKKYRKNHEQLREYDTMKYLMMKADITYI